MSDTQRHIAMVAMVTPACYFLLRIVQGTTGTKFPTTGANELLFMDSVLSGLICFFCSRLTAIQNHCKVLFFSIARLFILFILGLSFYFVPKWYNFKGSFLESALVWTILGIHIIASSACFTLIGAFFVSEELYRRYTWRSFKEYLFGKQVRLAPPEYNEAVVGSSLPPTYEEALATRPPGYTPTLTPPVPNSRAECHIVRINSTRSSVRFQRVWSDEEEEDEA